MEKNKLRIAAVQANDVEALTNLSDATEWHKLIDPNTGNTLLHIAVKRGNKEIFDYLLSNVDVPVNCRNENGDTVLSLCYFRLRLGLKVLPLDDHFACELIKKGASVDSVHLKHGDTFFHLVVREKYVKVSTLLMDMGYDLNAPNMSGVAPMSTCLSAIDLTTEAEPETIEILTAFLCHGAAPTRPMCKKYNAFEHTVLFCPNHLHGLFSEFFFDEYTSIHFETILILAKRRSSVFRDTVERAKDVIVNANDVCRVIMYLFTMDVEYLDLLIKKCPEAIREAFADVTQIVIKHITFCKKKFIENANTLLETDLRDDTIDFLCRFQDVVIVISQSEISEMDRSVALSYVCFLLSYGLQLNEDQLKFFYRRYGQYNELFKILLHMEIETKCPETYSWPPFGMLLYDVNCDLRRILEWSKGCCFSDMSHLLNYFSDAKLRARCGGSENSVVNATIENQPDVPLLSELARNVFRKFLVKAFNITRSSQFYTLVNALPIPLVHKKIITLETKLY